LILCSRSQIASTSDCIESAISHVLNTIYVIVISFSIVIVPFDQVFNSLSCVEISIDIIFSSIDVVVASCDYVDLPIDFILNSNNLISLAFDIIVVSLNFVDGNFSKFSAIHPFTLFVSLRVHQSLIRSCG
jgi:hypothetical protein